MSSAQEFRKQTTLRNLEAIYRTYVKSNSAIGRDGNHPARLGGSLNEEVRQIQKNMRNGNYRFTPFRQVLKIKGASQNPRVISIPTARDRITLRALTNTLSSSFNLEEFERPQLKINRISNAIAKNAYEEYIRVDIEDFYPTIDHEKLILELQTRIRKHEILSILSRAVSTPTIANSQPRSQPITSQGVPQGLSISNILAEIFMIPIDKNFMNLPGMSYFRYVDDILILCHTGMADQIEQNLDSEISARGLKAHPRGPGKKSSTGRIVDQFDYLGYVFNGTKISVRGSSIHRMENSIARVFTRYKYATKSSRVGFTMESWIRRSGEICEWYLNLVITGCIHEGRRHGWLQYFSQMDDIKILKKLDRQVRKFVSSYDLSATVVPKKFVSTYWAIQNPNSRRRNIVPNFDEIDRDNKQNILNRIFLIKQERLNEMNEIEVNSLFSRKVGKATSDLEKDIGSVYR
ncbi:reverse transcriptase domain-containing protein [Rhodococcus sp. ARC_M6]|uniref:reverse transcriptase domain-containing protein n=1 Tax=Rhodococcus sp. ARC_M6 TaxID=2928852 RepID=UPI001FB36B16|nr:reverse transcriptase domain-containing protein [Rhodococcus sp. ARC_M6]MCJ0906103.1 reverse transcriptase domain-containing protein [Rhodococcus sp. ARC_M6]